MFTFPLKAEDTIGSCQRLACTVGVNMHKTTNLELNRSSKLRDNNERSCVRLDG